MAFAVVVGGVHAPKHNGPSRMYFHTFLSSLLCARGDEQGNVPRFLSCSMLCTECAGCLNHDVDRYVNLWADEKLASIGCGARHDFAAIPESRGRCFYRCVIGMK